MQNITMPRFVARLLMMLACVAALCCALPANAFAADCAELSVDVIPVESDEVLACLDQEECADRAFFAATPSIQYVPWMSDESVVRGEGGTITLLAIHGDGQEKYSLRLRNAAGDLVGQRDNAFIKGDTPVAVHYVKVAVDSFGLNLPCGDYTLEYWLEYRASEGDSWASTPVAAASVRIVENVCAGHHSEFVYSDAIGDPTCVTEGWRHYYCERCGKDQWRREFGDHAWDGGSVAKEPVKGVAPGERVFTCTLCSQTRSELFRNATVERIAGDYANQTSALISSKTFVSSQWVVLARDDDFADAMSATGLAGALECPILLTNRTELSAAAAAEVKRLGATKAYVVGGKGALPADLEGELKAVGCTVEKRLFGEYSWDTSVACADEIKAISGAAYTDKAIVAMSVNFQDALSISSFAYKYKVPIFLQTQWKNRALPQEAVSRIKNAGGTIYVPGGPGAVTEASVEDVFGEERVVRMYGEDGYDTSNQIAHYMVDNGLLSADVAVVACGAQAAKGSDALSGAALAGKNGGVILLTNANPAFESQHLETIGGTDSAQCAGFMTGYRYTVDTCYVLGGAYVMPDEVLSKIADIIMGVLL